MIEICAWCKREIEEKAPIGELVYGYGLCKKCADMLKKKYRMSAALDSHDIEFLINHLAKTPAA